MSGSIANTDFDGHARPRARHRADHALKAEKFLPALRRVGVLVVAPGGHAEATFLR
jgi:hypothetical protein